MTKRNKLLPALALAIALSPCAIAVTAHHNALQARPVHMADNAKDPSNQPTPQYETPFG